MLVEEGWVAKVQRIIEKNKKGKEIDKGWTCELIPKALVINTYLVEEQQTLEDLQGALETTQAERAALEEEHSADEAALGTLDKINKAEVTKLNKELKAQQDEEATAFAKITQLWLKLYTKEASLKKDIKAAEAELDKNTLAQYGKLTEAEVRQLVIEDKWLASLYADIQTEIDGISQRLANRIKELAARYGHTLNELDTETQDLEHKVSAHLEKMGLVWN